MLIDDIATMTVWLSKPGNCWSQDRRRVRPAGQLRDDQLRTRPAEHPEHILGEWAALVGGDLNSQQIGPSDSPGDAIRC